MLIFLYLFVEPARTTKKPNAMRADYEALILWRQNQFRRVINTKRRIATRVRTNLALETKIVVTTYVITTICATTRDSLRLMV